jgi:hypothetical protein
MMLCYVVAVCCGIVLGNRAFLWVWAFTSTLCTIAILYTKKVKGCGILILVVLQEMADWIIG